MNTKDALLALLEEHRGQFISGEEIASSLFVSRAAVWKAIEVLRTAGYPIEAVRRRGYRLADRADILSAGGIKKHLSDQSLSEKMTVAASVTSTNTILKEKAAGGAPDLTILIAANQTQGKGRAGRSFFSPDQTGVYMSLLLRPEHCDAAQAAQFTTMAAVAACKAIEEAAGCQALIKWVNDVYVNGRKVSGILTEASLDLERGTIDYAVLGIGFNAYEPAEGFPEDIKARAGAVFTEPEPDGKNLLAASFINHFVKYYRGRIDHVEEYRKRSFVIGKEIDVISGGKSVLAKALGIDRDCRLLVEYNNGKTEKLSTGEVSIRVLQGKQ